MKTARANKAIKKGSMVRVVTGKSKGKTGKVSKIMKKNNMCLIEKVNMVKKHVKQSQENPQGGIVSIEAPIHLSNVTLIEAQETPKKTAKKTTKKTADKKPAKKASKKEAKKDK